MRACKCRFGDMETIPQYTVATFLDPRFKSFFFTNTSTVEEVCEIVTGEVLAILGEAPVPLSKSNSVSSQSSEDSFTEGSFGAAMRKFVEKKKTAKNHQEIKSELRR